MYIRFIIEELLQFTNNILTFHKLNLDCDCIKYTIVFGILVLFNVHPI